MKLALKASSFDAYVMWINISFCQVFYIHDLPVVLREQMEIKQHVPILMPLLANPEQVDSLRTQLSHHLQKWHNNGTNLQGTCEDYMRSQNEETNFTFFSPFSQTYMTLRSFIIGMLVNITERCQEFPSNQWKIGKPMSYDEVLMSMRK